MKKQLLTLASMLSLATCTQAQVSFAPKVNYGTGSSSGPRSLFSTDYNSDGFKDLVTANINSNDVSILLGSASGTFTPAVNYGVDTNPFTVFSADFNGDGNMDVATANIGSNNVSVLLGSSTGTFAAAVNYSVGSNPGSVFSADFNGDGKMDLVTANEVSNNVSVLLGSGTGTFAAAVNYSVGSGPFSVYSADFNSDGKMDLATANDNSNNVSILFGSSTGTFAAAINYSVGLFPMSIFSADFNGDGFKDLATANYFSDDISILLGSATGTFATAVNYGLDSSPTCVFSSDYNGDGKMDLVTTFDGSSKVSILLGYGTGIFASAVEYEIAGSGAVTAFSDDFNGDGKMDLSTANYDDDNLSVILNNTVPTYTTGAGAALNFWDNSYVTVPTATNFPIGNSPYTLEAYIKPALLHYGGIIGWGNYGTSGEENTLSIDEFGNIKNSWLSGADLSASSGTLNLADGNWHHVAATYDGIEKKIYIDGELAGSTYVGPLTLAVPHATNVTIGNTSFDVNFKGGIDEVRVWTRALCQAEIQNNMSGELSVPQTSLVAYYQFNQGMASAPNPSVTTLTNLVGATNTGSLTSFALTGAFSNWVAPGAVTTGSMAPSMITVLSPTAICNGNSAVLAASSTLTAMSYTWSTSATTTSISVSPTVTTIYNVVATNTDACMPIKTITLTVNALPTVLASTSNSIICIGQTATLTASGATSYTWNTSATTTVIAVSPTVTTTYTVNGTDANSCANSTTVSVTANICSAAETLHFDGTDDRVMLGSSLNPILNSSNKITVEAWVKPSINTGLGCIVGNYNTSNADMQFLLRRDFNKFAFYVDNGGGFTSVTSVATASTGVWQHVAGSWNGSVLSIYVNGVLSNTATLAGANLRNNTNPIWIGANQIGENFTGSIDEVRIWNKTLCQPEIQNNMNGEIATIAPNLLANYHFNQGIAASTNTTITTLIDASASALTGTLTNIALTGATSNWIAPGGVTSGSLVTALVGPTVAIAGAGTICSGTSTTLTASGSVSSFTWTSGPITATNVVSPSTTTTYSVVGTATNGCVSNMAMQTLTVNPKPIVTVNSGAICYGKTFTIVPSGASTYTVQGGSTIVTPTTNTTYSVIGTSTAGCVSSNTAISTVTVNSLPTVLASTSNSIICTGQTATLSASGATSYTWNTSATTTVIAVSPTVTTTYTVNGTDANGCSNTTTMTQNVSSCTGVTSLANSDVSINVYPNPNNGLFIIELTSVSKVTVTNALGQVVFAEMFEAGKHDVNIYSEATGVYFIKVMANNKQQIIKVIKE